MNNIKSKIIKCYYKAIKLTKLITTTNLTFTNKTFKNNKYLIIIINIYDVLF